MWKWFKYKDANSLEAIIWNTVGVNKERGWDVNDWLFRAGGDLLKVREISNLNDKQWDVFLTWIEGMDK